ncbi:MAG: hypothetical protein QOF57_1945 [Frankiaceae bacterium]|jgi:uncharacterized protein (DUF1501 family)|nr:hypothetical protein [Frankiaceae bacterium]MDQ1726439.1 hypothetical protein [Frankiaceae bacterium]
MTDDTSPQATPGELRRQLAACGCPQDGDHAAPGGITRRRFLGTTAGVAGLGVLGGLTGSLASTQLAFADVGAIDSDVLVVVSLRGGFDGLNAVVPTGDPSYLKWRPTIGVPQSKLVQLDPMFGLHPALAGLKPLYDAGTLAFAHAVGQADPSRSHFAAMEEMERAAPGSSLRTGWIDRVIGVTGAPSTFTAVSMGGSAAPTSFLGPNPELALSSVDGFTLNGAWDVNERQRWRTALSALYAGAPATVAAPARATLGALGATATLQDAGYTPDGGAVYPSTELGKALRDIARLIKAGLGLRVAALDCGDWDMHVGMGDADSGWQQKKLKDVADSFVAFTTDMGAGMSGVTLMTLSEFGRRVEENGSGGADHGHGNAVMMLGGGVIGGKVYGRWPGLAAANLVDGDLGGTTDYRTLLAEVLEKRLKISAASVFPRLSATRVGMATPRG